MSSPEFVVKNSITTKLKRVMILIAFFFILSAVSVYISSLSFFTGLQSIHSANTILSLTTQSIEGLDTSHENLEKMRRGGNYKDIKFAFDESQEMLKSNIQRSIDASRDNSEVNKLLDEGLKSVKLYEESINLLFTSPLIKIKNKSKDQLEDLNSELLVASQFLMDSREYLRKAQIVLRKTTDNLFYSIYKSRFRPLIVAITLSAGFFLFVVTFGISIADRIADAVKNLISATEKVREGNLSFAAPILKEDEFGLVTNAFNNMIRSLNEGREALDDSMNRIQRLQKITANFSEALTVEEVIDVTLKEGFEYFSPESGTIALISPESKQVEIKKFFGYSEEAAKPWRTLPLNTISPITDAAREKKAIFYGKKEILHATYPDIDDFVKNDIKSLVALPLTIGNRCLGAVSFTFNRDQEFSEAEKNFMVAVGRQCSQALYRSRLYDESQNAIQIRDEFLSIASHELKTPLTPLKLQLQLLGRELKQDDHPIHEERVAKVLDNTDRQLNRLTKLVEDLLDVSRISSGKLKYNFEQINLSDLIKEVISQYGLQTKEALENVIVDIEENVEISGDYIRVEQVIINLLTNALKYAPGKPIHVTLKKADSVARVSVKDQGPGIAPENQARIFNRFERVRASDNIGGLGLGLYISHQIVEGHHGKIFVKSEPEKGSDFIVELPLLK